MAIESEMIAGMCDIPMQVMMRRAYHNCGGEWEYLGRYAFIGSSRYEHCCAGCGVIGDLPEKYPRIYHAEVGDGD